MELTIILGKYLKKYFINEEKTRKIKSNFK